MAWTVIPTTIKLYPLFDYQLQRILTLASCALYKYSYLLTYLHDVEAEATTQRSRRS